ncbi:hypothetical protein [Candidatus Methanoperedens nitratireducens]|uniref:Uncharacterized protein n=1 Tax=Candidatus Methanoperedens nitratireducens TaxID=1392998 RepID=A0A284VJG8_9EURY|nr:hypothetical protein [Candidatus Methanoperedens nitroreducens]SNQ59393.1 hypothetical protein MNV_1180011 [Candidatus Methanoperedens nitroreducens]
MEQIKLFPIVLVTLSLIFLGCVGETPVGTPIPTAVPTATETPQPTIVPAVPAPTPALPQQQIAPPVKYIVWIDSDLGFYRIRAVRGNTSVRLPADFSILNFSINVGDKVRWMNDDSYDFPLTLVSNEGLWTGRAGLMRYQGERVEYTFNKTGIYTFSIKEYPRIGQQKITVVH